MYYRRLPLKKLKNCRELGGFPTADGGVTRYGVFIRSEIPHELPDSDLDFLWDYGITDAMDFRGEVECGFYPNSLKGLDWLTYHWIPMFTNQVAPQSGKTRMPHFTFVSWQQAYIGMCDDYPGWVRQTVELAAASEGGLIFNCTTGKDRTGILSALLLSVAGVDRADIIADYASSMVYLHTVYGSMGFPEDLPADFFETPPAAMGALLDHLEEKYGGVTGYLRACGVADETLTQIRTKFVELDPNRLPDRA